MKKQIIRVSPLQNAKVMAVLYFVLSLPFALIMMLMPTPDDAGFTRWFWIAMPVGYLAFGFIFALIAAWVYNILAKQVGGFEFTTAEVPAVDKVA